MCEESGLQIKGGRGAAQASGPRRTSGKSASAGWAAGPFSRTNRQGQSVGGRTIAMAIPIAATPCVGGTRFTSRIAAFQAAHFAEDVHPPAEAITWSDEKLGAWLRQAVYSAKAAKQTAARLAKEGSNPFPGPWPKFYMKNCHKVQDITPCAGGGAMRYRHTTTGAPVGQQPIRCERPRQGQRLGCGRVRRRHPSLQSFAQGFGRVRRKLRARPYRARIVRHLCAKGHARRRLRG